MQRWKLTLAYDGTCFHGWQVQPRLATIQGTLASALYRITGETLLPQGSGRTDTGVHALAQVASFDLANPIPPPNLLRALNRALPPSIRILSADHAAPTFHARHSALRKSYEYRVFPRVPAKLSRRQATQPPPDRICPPTLAPYLWDCPWPISFPAAQQAASHILGEHDFTSFAAVDPDRASRDSHSIQSANHADAPSNLRTIHYSCWTEEDGNLIYRITGSGFLHHMVRNLVGTFIDAAAGRILPDSIPRILAARSRHVAGPTAPAQGLFLVSVEYPADPSAPSPATQTWDHPPRSPEVNP